MQGNISRFGPGKRQRANLKWKKTVSPVEGWRLSHQHFFSHPKRVVRTGITLIFVLLFVVPLSDPLPGAITLKARHAQNLLNQLQSELNLSEPVRITLVVRNPLVFSVEPDDRQKTSFLLSMDVAFLQILDESELRAALAHELGHVWIFKHHPFLQTERLANEVGQRLVSRDSMERMYTKLWAYEKTPGVPFDTLLGPSSDMEPRQGDRP